MTPMVTGLNVFITVVAIAVGVAQFVFIYNFVRSWRRGEPAGQNPSRATTLEWQTPEVPPAHDNWGKNVPTVYRWPYDYSVPGAVRDFIPQNEETPQMRAQA